MALTGKNISGYSKLEKLNFSCNSFTDSEAMIFDGDAIVSIMSQIKSKLNEISKLYDDISDKYEKALNCTASGKKMDTKNNTDGKRIKKYQTKCEARANRCRTRKTELVNKIETLKMTLDAINSANDQTTDNNDNIADE